MIRKNWNEGAYNMKRKYILINNEKLNISSWIKWIILIVSYFLCLLVISIVENLASNLTHISMENIGQVTFYIRAFIILSLIYDLAPRFKVSISIIYSVLASLLYLNIDAKAGDRLYLGTLLFLIGIILYNIYLYKKAPCLNSR